MLRQQVLQTCAALYCFMLGLATDVERSKEVLCCCGMFWPLGMPELYAFQALLRSIFMVNCVCPSNNQVPLQTGRDLNPGVHALGCCCRVSKFKQVEISAVGLVLMPSSGVLAQAIQGSIFRAPLQGLNALAPSAAFNFSGQMAAAEVAAAAARGAPSNAGATPVRVPLGPSAPGQYIISATKQNSTNITIAGPQVTNQVGKACRVSLQQNHHIEQQLPPLSYASSQVCIGAACSASPFSQVLFVRPVCNLLNGWD